MWQSISARDWTREAYGFVPLPAWQLGRAQFAQSEPSDTLRPLAHGCDGTPGSLRGLDRAHLTMVCEPRAVSDLVVCRPVDGE